VLAGLGSALPDFCISQAGAEERAADLVELTVTDRRMMRAVYRLSGVRTRRSVLLELSENGGEIGQSFYRPQTAADDHGPSTGARMCRYEQDAPKLAIQASTRALQAAHRRPDEVTHLVTVSCSGFSAPGFDLALLEQLDLPREVARTHVGFMGCHGALNGLRVAHAFTSSDPRALVLVCAVELCSLHHQYTLQRDQFVANSLFGDGSAAAVVHATASAASSSPSLGPSTNWRIMAQRSFVIPDTADLMAWRIRDQGFQMSLSAQVPQVIEASLKPWLEGWLGSQGFRLQDVGSWAIHPGGPRILDAVESALKLPTIALAASRSVLAECGNLSSPTLFIILQRMQASQAALPCVAIGFGPGLTIEAALIC
jgi:predicted naringenin-chalcone synthase